MKTLTMTSMALSYLYDPCGGDDGGDEAGDGGVARSVSMIYHCSHSLSQLW